MNIRMLKRAWLAAQLFAYWLFAQVVSVLYVFTAVLVRGRALPTQVTGSLCSALGVRCAVTPASKPLCSTAESMVLCNHRSWADFFVDSALTGGGTYLSRLLVCVGVPGPSLFGWVTGAVWFFQRGKKVEKGGVKVRACPNSRARLPLATCAPIRRTPSLPCTARAHSPSPALPAQRDSTWWTEYFRRGWREVRPGAPVIVYPEGTRNQKAESLPLKLGCVKVAHSLGTPVQVVIATQKESIFNEKAGKVQRGVRCVVAVSPVLKPQDFACLEKFIAAVEAAWKVRPRPCSLRPRRAKAARASPQCSFQLDPHTHSPHTTDVACTCPPTHTMQATWKDAHTCSVDKAVLQPTMLLPGAIPRYTKVNAQRLLIIRAIAAAAAALAVVRFL